MTMKKILIPAFLLIAANAMCQDKDWNLTRQVIIRNADSLIYANILLDRTPLKAENEKTYFWYLPDYINFNRGGYSGQLLHGEYCLYDRNFNLIEKGMIEKGLKTGTWKRWNPDGTLQKAAVWKNGLISGTTVYDADGHVADQYRYRKGELMAEKSRPEKTNKKIKGIEGQPGLQAAPADSSLVSVPVIKSR